MYTIARLFAISVAEYPITRVVRTGGVEKASGLCHGFLHFRQLEGHVQKWLDATRESGVLFVAEEVERAWARVVEADNQRCETERECVVCL